MVISACQTECPEIQRLRDTGVSELADQFALARARLRKMVDLRLDARMAGRVDASDVVQEVYIEAARRLPEYLTEPKVVPFLWLRQVTRQTLARHYREHAGTEKRCLDREAKWDQVAANSESMVGELSASMNSPHSQIAQTELIGKLLDIIESMDAADREILSLKQLEQLTFDEVANELEISLEAAKKRYQRAVLRLGKLAAHLNSSG